MSPDSTTNRNPSQDASAELPWYHAGLRFECTQCGDCCTGAPGVVWVTDEEIAEIAAVSGLSTGEVRLFHTRLAGGRTSLREFANGDCTFFDPETRGCTVYEARPAQCRTWPFWGSNTRTPEAWEKTCDDCPGAGNGVLYSLEQIQQRQDVIDM